MTIKTKLIANVLVTTAIVVAITVASFLAMRFLQQKLAYLTEESAPFQMKTIELQRELQGCITTLIKVNAARTMAEYTKLQGEAEKKLEQVENTQNILEQMSSATPVVLDDLDKIALELFTASEERINSNNAATAAYDKVLRSLKESSDRLNELDTHIRNLQTNRSVAYARMLENTGHLSARLRGVEDLRNLVKDLSAVSASAIKSHNSATFLIAKGKIKTLLKRIARNKYSNLITAGDMTIFPDTDEFLQLQAAALLHKDETSRKWAEESLEDLTGNLNRLHLTLNQEIELVAAHLDTETKKQGIIFAQSNNANSILVANSELVALGLKVTGDTNQLFLINSLAELDKLDSVILSLFAKINDRVQMIEGSLSKLNGMEELRILSTAVASLANIRKEIYSIEGIVATLKKKLKASKQADESTDRLHSIVMKQSARGNESVSIAQREQRKAIVAVYQMIRRSKSQIVAIGIIAIITGILFGFWVYRSVLRPLSVVLDAVRSQQEQGKEKALLVEAIAGGDLSRQVTIGKAIALDSAQMKKDEMGMVLKAIVAMSAVQVALDRAFAGMTASLCRNRDEEARRDRLKRGLYELNKILRQEMKITELADKTLAFLADYLGAGVAVLYLYEENNEMLQTLATYAIAGNTRLDQGFRLGEGLPGQVALERKMICLDSIPPDYLQISSALGAADPRNVAIMPIMYNDIMAGVLELGSFKLFGEEDLEFLKLSLEGIAIAFNVTRSRQKVNDLLEQTQQLAEELRVQQEELQQSNEELEERARALMEQRNFNRY